MDERIRGQALIGRAQLSMSLDPADAEPVARAGLDLCRASGDAFWTAAGLNLLSEIAVHTGRPDEAETLGREATAIAEDADDGWNLGWALGIRAAVAGLRGNMRDAADLARASIEVMRLGRRHRWGVARAQLGLGDLARLGGDLDGAKRMYTDALGTPPAPGGRGDLRSPAACAASARVAISTSAPASRAPGSTWRRACGSAGTSARTSGWRAGGRSCAALTAREGATERAVMLAAASAGMRATSGLPPLPAGRADRYLARPDRASPAVATTRVRPRCSGHAGLALLPRGRRRPGDRAGPAGAAPWRCAWRHDGVGAARRSPPKASRSPG